MTKAVAPFAAFGIEDMNAGHIFPQRNVRSIRPGQGLAPKHLPEVLGRTAARDIARGTPLSREMVAGPGETNLPDNG